MLRSLVRRPFIDKSWGAEELEHLARFWVRLHDEADKPPHLSWEASQTLELHLTGFVRHASPAVSDELTKRLLAASVPVTVSAADPDTLIARTEPHAADRPPFAGLGVHALGGAPFDGLVIEVRFTVAATSATAPASERVGATLVIVGELRGGAIVVKAVWSDPAFAPDPGAWTAPGGFEEMLPRAFARFKQSGEVDRRLATDLFSPSQRKPTETAFARFRQRVIDVPFGRPRLPGLASCVVLAAIPPGVTAFCVWASYWTHENAWLLPPLALALPWFAFAIPFFEREYGRLVTDYKRFRAWYAWRFQLVERSVLLPAGERRAWFNNPAVRKLTDDVLGAGFVHAGDFNLISKGVGASVHRAFLAPDGRTYLALFFAFETEPGPDQRDLWPASAAALCRTYFTTTGRFDTTNYSPLFHTLGRKEPAVHVSVQQAGTHPLDVFRAHTEELARWSAETGVTPAPHTSLERYLVQHEAIAERREGIYNARPYSWREHIRWYLQLDAPAASKSG